MNHNWQHKPFKQLADILYGCPFESEFFNTESKGMPLIRIRDVKLGFTSTYFDGIYSKEYLIKKGEYLIGMDGEFNIAPWQSEDALLNQRVCRVKSLNEKIILTDFIFYFLGKELKSIEGQTSFVTVKHLSAKVLNAISTPVPQMEVQEQIVAELDKINEVIGDCRELLRNLDALSQSLFYDYFGDPVTNPKGWKVKSLKDLVIGKLTYGSGASGVPYNNLLRYIRITDIDDYGCLKPEIASSPSVYDPKYDLSDGDILFARSGATVGKAFLYRASIGRAIYAGYLIKATVNRNSIIPIYLYALTKTVYYRNYIRSSIRGAAQPNVNARVYGVFQIPVPPLELQKEFAKAIKAIEAIKATVQSLLTELQTLLDSRMDFWFN